MIRIHSMKAERKVEIGSWPVIIVQSVTGAPLSSSRPDAT
jgi:hypothetical protein